MIIFPQSASHFLFCPSFFARSPSLVPPSHSLSPPLSFSFFPVFFFTTNRRCVWAILEHSAQRAPSSPALRLGGTCQLESNTSPSNNELMDCWVRELKNKPGWLRQEHPFTHHLSPRFYLPMWISGGSEPIFNVDVCVWGRTGKSINHILYSTGELDTIASHFFFVHEHLFTRCQVHVLNWKIYFFFTKKKIISHVKANCPHLYSATVWTEMLILENTPNHQCYICLRFPAFQHGLRILSSMLHAPLFSIFYTSESGTHHNECLFAHCLSRADQRLR